MTKCTLCGKNIGDFKIKIEIKIEAERLTKADTWELIPNSILNVREMLCKTCFDKFAETMSKIGNQDVH